MQSFCDFSKLILPAVLLVNIFQSTFTIESGHVFTFAHPRSFFKLEPDWPLPNSREISFRFRTDRPQGLLFYHGVNNLPRSSQPYELYLMIENGQLKVIHIFSNISKDEPIFVGKGLNSDKWHSVHLKVDPESGDLTVRVDAAEITKTLQSLKEHPAYGLHDHMTDSFIYFGGMDPDNPVYNQQYNYVRFVGCMEQVQLGHSNQPQKAVELVSHGHITRGSCKNKCHPHNPCRNGGRCINHYTSTSCDCFGTSHENNNCRHSNLTIVTFRGNTHITFHADDWRDKLHSEPSRISLTFSTFLADSVLFYGAGKHPVPNYLTININKGKVVFEINFGDGPLRAELGHGVNDNVWHNFTMVRHGRQIHLQMGQDEQELNCTGKHHNLHFEPEVYFGGVSQRLEAQGIKMTKKFVGCLKDVYFNDKNILFSLRDARDLTVKHHGTLPLETGCTDVKIIPLTLSSIGGYIVYNQLPDIEKNVTFSIEFKTTQADCFLASGATEIGKKRGFWELVLQKGVASFSLVPDVNRKDQHWDVTKGSRLSDGRWHQVDITVRSGDIKINVDFGTPSDTKIPVSLHFLGEMQLGANTTATEIGFVGCLRDIRWNGLWLDPRQMILPAYARGKVSLNNCQFVDPCRNSRACEHGGKCYVEKGVQRCNCTGTGYTGATCHFAMYKRTCEELYLLGYRESGVYKIDIDRNGPLPPANVYCDMEPGDGTIATRVENNLPSEMVVRRFGMKGFYMNITYRDFTEEMLQSLIDQSKKCSQHFKYDCKKAPIGLYTFTWMQSSFKKFPIHHIGNAGHSRCPCAETKSCANPEKMCNCDSGDEEWRTDEGFFTNPEDLAITRVYIMQPSNPAADADARLAIGPLECVETDTQQYVITFKTKHSYLEVPGWRNGDMAFSFRTSNNRAVLLYQASAYADHGYFRVLLTSDHELSFEFTVDGVPRTVKVESRRRLNSGEWQQVWVDHDTHHMRFTINLDSELIDLGDEEVGPFEGPMFIGAVPDFFKSDSQIKEGFIGCFRGLVINSAVVDVYQYLTRTAPDIATGCKPSCTPNPCKHSAPCIEFWGTYRCDCINTIAQSGINCENDINENALTFITPSSYYHNTSLGSDINPVLIKDILLNFRTYEKEVLLFYAFDNNNNFVQLHLTGGNTVIFSYNSGTAIAQCKVQNPDVAKGFPIQVRITRSQKETKLEVEKTEVVIGLPIKFLTNYSQHPWDDEEDEKELVGPIRPVVGSLPHSELYIGGIKTPEMTSKLPGFVGCLQGFKIGDELFDLQGITKSNVAVEEMRPGCKMLCDSHPCQHRGLCIEDWKNGFTSCDCSMTSYIGEVCNREYGGSFDGKSMVLHGFPPEVVSPNSVSIHLAFSSDDRTDIKHSLLVVYFNNSKYNYISVGLNLDGTLLFEEVLGSQKFRANFLGLKNETLVDGFRHWIQYDRTPQKTELLVDGVRHIPKMERPDLTGPEIPGINESNLVVVGGTLSKDHRFENFANFRGCISNVKLSFDSLQIKPLETAFGYVQVDGVSVIDKIKKLGKVDEETCADFAVGAFSTTSMPIISNETKQKWSPKNPVTELYDFQTEHLGAKHLKQVTVSTARVAIVLGLFLIIVMLALLLYLYKTHRRHKMLQFEEETMFFTTSKRQPTYPVKVVKFNDNRPYKDNMFMQPLHQTPEADLRTKAPPLTTKPPEPKGYKPPAYSPYYEKLNNSDDDMRTMPMNSLRPSSSQELEWDPAADTEDLITTAMDEDEAELQEKDNLGNLLPRNGPHPAAPMASTSEMPSKYRLDDLSGSLVFNNFPYE